MDLPRHAASRGRTFAGKPLGWTRGWTVVVLVWAVAAAVLVAARVEVGHVTALSAREAAAIDAVEASKVAAGGRRRRGRRRRAHDRRGPAARAEEVRDHGGGGGRCGAAAVVRDGQAVGGPRLRVLGARRLPSRSPGRSTTTGR